MPTILIGKTLIDFPDYITEEMREVAKASCINIYEATGNKLAAIKFLKQSLEIPLRDAKDLFVLEYDPALSTDRMKADRIRDAAPELLAALTALLSQVECGTGLECPVCDAARSAIAKASRDDL